jgi:hypothetical protein
MRFWEAAKACLTKIPGSHTVEEGALWSNMQAPALYFAPVAPNKLVLFPVSPLLFAMPARLHPFANLR